MSLVSETHGWKPIEGEPRYFRRNAARAMAGQIVRGLVELITNARDSGYRLFSAGKLTAQEIEAHPVEVEYVVNSDGKKTLLVRDRFEGMTAEVMKEKLLRYGASASGFEHGEFVRGINARGAKDAGGLGRVRFESIVGDRYSECEISDGFTRGPFARQCTMADRDRIGIRAGNGTLVTLFPNENTSVPGFDALAQDLERHVEIRYRPETQPYLPILMRERRARKVGTERELVGFRPDGILIRDETIHLPEWGLYGGATAQLRVWRTESPLAAYSSRNNTARLWKNEAGVIVADGRTAHDITLFSARGADDTAARHVFGELLLPQIPGLLKEFDQLETKRDAGDSIHYPELNPSQVTDPDRLGLNREHPFVVAVEERVRPFLEAVLKEIQDEIAPSAQQRIGDALKEALEKLGKKLSELLDETWDPPFDKGPRWGLSIVPGALRLELGHERKNARRVTVYYRVEPAQTPDSVACDITTDSPAIQLSAAQLTLSRVEELPGVLRGSFDVVATALTDLASVTVAVDGKTQHVSVSVRDPINGAIDLEKDLQFSQRSYTAVPGKRKKIEVFADPALADRDVTISLSKDAIGLSETSVHMEFDLARKVAVGVLFADCTSEASDKITAKCGEFTDEALVSFEDLENVPTINFLFTDAPSYQGRRFKWDQEDRRRILIAGGHSTMARLLGPKQETSTGDTWPGQWSPQTRAVLAELIADAFSYRRLEKEALMQEFFDFFDYERRRYEVLEETYPLCHQLLTPAYGQKD